MNMKDSTPLVSDPGIIDLVKKYPPQPKMPPRFAQSQQQSSLSLYPGQDKKRFLEVFNIDKEAEGDTAKVTESNAVPAKTSQERST